MKRIKDHIIKGKKCFSTLFILPSFFFLLTAVATSCIDEEKPTQEASAEQVEGSSASLKMRINGLSSKMISQQNYYGEAYRGTWYATQDWGYPCYMYIRETMLDGFPTTDASWNYQIYYEKASNLTGYSGCPFYFYYGLINNANSILAALADEASEEILQYYAIARVYRALAYSDLTMMYEFYPTGIAELDAKAEKVFGLTVPLVTEETTRESGKNNPRAPFYKMYRFIFNDLSIAEATLKNYSRNSKTEPNIDVVNALLSRFWLNLATRFRLFPDDLAKQIEHEGDDDGGKDLGIKTANDCYRKAYDYADKVVAAGYTPVTESQWKDSKTGFNTENQAWIWDMRFSSKEQVTDYWCSHIGLTASEPTWGMPAYGGAYRCIASKYYNKMQSGDWRKVSWIAPEDAGSETVPEKYNSLLKEETKATKADKTNFSRLPAYANLKFRPGSGSIDDEQTGMLCDIPLIRIEEMHFVMIESTFYLNGLEAGKKALEEFLNSYRYTNGEYYCDSSYSADFIYEMIAQKFIELWGEGVLYNDFKRLRLAVVRDYADTNYLDTYLLNSTDGYTAPWLNFYIPETERNFNSALENEMNPDPTPYCK
ncbi:MAG: RagB/SusD family nutrient uptake outer membrane protein [Prevotella sp.]